MDIKLNAIQIFVSNLSKAKEWYSEILGMKFIEEYPDIKCVLMELGDIHFFIETPTPEWGEG
jgi:catechol 2,3-dioxygenase-like lactoylglutathione lyase family enzyme